MKSLKEKTESDFNVLKKENLIQCDSNCNWIHFINQDDKKNKESFRKA